MKRDAYDGFAEWLAGTWRGMDWRGAWSWPWQWRLDWTFLLVFTALYGTAKLIDWLLS